jgi:hypothetical protein
MVAVPSAIPLTIPVVAPTVAAPAGVAVAVQMPPPGELVIGVLAPTHTLPAPEIAPGYGLTLTVLVTKQPLPRS